MFTPHTSWFATNVKRRHIYTNLQGTQGKDATSFDVFLFLLVMVLTLSFLFDASCTGNKNYTALWSKKLGHTVIEARNRIYEQSWIDLEQQDREGENVNVHELEGQNVQQDLPDENVHKSQLALPEVGEENVEVLVEGMHMHGLEHVEDNEMPEQEHAMDEEHQENQSAVEKRGPNFVGKP